MPFSNLLTSIIILTLIVGFEDEVDTTETDIRARGSCRSEHTSKSSIEVITRETFCEVILNG